MNKPQRDVLLTGFIVIALMALVPPWTNANSYNGGYGLVFLPPHNNVTVDLARLAAQIILVAAVCAALYLYFKRGN